MIVRHVGASPEPLLSVNGLSVEFPSGDGWTRVVDSVDLSIREGEIFAVVGESGCGKTVLSRAVIGLTALNGGRLASGTIDFGRQDLAAIGPSAMNDIRGSKISMVFQQPTRSLNPVFTIGQQLVAVYRRHMGGTVRAARLRAIDLLQKVGIREAERRIDDYPHMFSGGMCQRVMIAMALMCSPRLLIADEPTTALDVTIQAQILRLLEGLREREGLSIMLITHDLGVVAQIADRVAVMYAGQIVETASCGDLFRAPAHPYSSALLASMPSMLHRNLRSIPGSVPLPHEWPDGCRFAARCLNRLDDPCLRHQPLKINGDRLVRCARSQDLELTGATA